MAAQSKKHGRKGSGHEHGGKDMKKVGKRHGAKKAVGKGRASGLTLLERERLLLAEADPFAQRPASQPAPLPVPEVATSPDVAPMQQVAPHPEVTPIPQVAPRPEVPAERVPEASVLASPDPGARETEEFLEAIGVGRGLRRGRIAALAVAAVCGVVFVRACAPTGAPVEDDTAEAGSCSGDAAGCVA